MDIQGQAVLVTGGASGLGEATARELARLGAKVAVIDVNLELAEKVAADIGGIACECDITNTDSVLAALASATASAKLHTKPPINMACERAASLANCA